MTQDEILDILDNCNDGHYCSFVTLDDWHSYLIDTRLNVFFSDENEWAIAVERLGYNPRAGTVHLEIHYYGNCLINLEYHNERPTSYYNATPVDWDHLNSTLDDERLMPDAQYWLVRGQRLPLSHSKQDYAAANIQLKEFKPDEISPEEAARLLVFQNPAPFRATDEELYKSIPAGLRKVLVLDEWYHKDFVLPIPPRLTEAQLSAAYELSKTAFVSQGISFEKFLQINRQQEIVNNDRLKQMWDNNRPSTYETWQLIAKVIATKDPSQYKPTLEPNTHWINWPDSGSM